MDKLNTVNASCRRQAPPAVLDIPRCVGMCNHRRCIRYSVTARVFYFFWPRFLWESIFLSSCTLTRVSRAQSHHKHSCISYRHKMCSRAHHTGCYWSRKRFAEEADEKGDTRLWQLWHGRVYPHSTRPHVMPVTWQSFGMRGSAPPCQRRACARPAEKIATPSKMEFFIFCGMFDDILRPHALIIKPAFITMKYNR